MTRSDIDDAETPVAQADIAIDKEPCFVGPRCVMTSRIASTTACETIRPDLLDNAMPLIPHIGIQNPRTALLF